MERVDMTVIAQTTLQGQRLRLIGDETNNVAMTAERCRVNAEECMSLAAQTSNPEAHCLFLRVARSWRWLAGERDDRAPDAAHPGGLPGCRHLGLRRRALAVAGAGSA
jgi:hypothetical protein